jgi:SAM-dependent methyltransferase
MRADLWLDRWLPLIRQRSSDGLILELGCGTGRDTATLVRAGHRVVALDLSLAAIALAKLRAPKAKFHRQDLRHPFPIGEAGTEVVIASLSLHYFPWPETVELVERIRRSLRPNGLLLCRLNSTKDRNFGAVGHERIAENFYRVRGAPKRFFDLEAIRNLFAAGWNTLSVQESVIDRYLQAKTAWEIVLERNT